MRKPLVIVTIVCCVALIAVSPALAASRTRDLPHRYLPNSLDGRLETATNPGDGSDWSAWAYRNGSEYDIAVSHRDQDGQWSEPLLIGEFDGRDQSEPFLATDRFGTVYLAFAERSPDRIMIAWKLAGRQNWTAPQPITADGLTARTPAVRVVGDRLVLCFRAGRGIVIADYPIADPVAGTTIFNDGPDPVEVHEPPGDGDEDDEGDSIYPFGSGSSSGNNPPGEGSDGS